MEDLRIGAAFRAIRRKRKLRQMDVARSASCSISTISRFERGLFSELTVGRVRRIAATLQVGIDLRPRWRGGELDRLLDRAHAALGTEVVAELTLLGWSCRPEMSFSIFGERGSVDVLAWHPPTGSLLVIELKTVVVDLQDTISTLDRKLRLAPRIVADVGWEPRTVSGWLIVTDGKTARRRLAEHRALLKAAFPADGRLMRRWLRHPDGPLRAMSFWPNSRARNTRP